MIFTFIFNLETYFSTKFSYALFVYIYWDPSLVNICETIAGDRSNQFGLLTEHKFCRKSSRGISIDIRFCNRFINLGRPIFPLNPLPRRCLQSRQHSGSYMRRVTLALSGPPNLRPDLDHRYLIFLLFHQPIKSPKLYLPSVRSVVLVKTQLQSM